MPNIFIGTDSGVWQLLNYDKGPQQEEGPLTAAFLARTQERLLALTLEGALWARQESSGWQLVNERPVVEEVWAFAADSRIPGRLYLGVSPALLYRSDDGGISWKAINSVHSIPGYERWTFPPPPHIPHVRFIAPDPQVTGAVYIGVEEGGIYYSRDGEIWESLNEGLYWDVHTVVPSPNDARLYATTGGGFYRSDDGGRHWQHVTDGLDRSYIVPCVVAPRPDLLYAAAAAGPPRGWRMGANAALYRSDDGGKHWVQLKRGLPPQFQAMVRALALDESGGVYAAAGHELYASFDDGESWQLVADNLPTVRALSLVDD